MSFYQPSDRPIRNEKLQARTERAVVDSLRAEIDSLRLALQTTKQNSEAAIDNANRLSQQKIEAMKAETQQALEASKRDYEVAIEKANQASQEALETSKRDYESALANLRQEHNNALAAATGDLQRTLNSTQEELTRAQAELQHLEALKTALAHSRRAQSELRSLLKSTRADLDNAYLKLGSGQPRSKFRRLFAMDKLFYWTRSSEFDDNASSDLFNQANWEGFCGVLYNGSTLSNHDPDKSRNNFESNFTSALQERMSSELARLQRCTMDLQAASNIAIQNQRAHQLSTSNTVNHVLPHSPSQSNVKASSTGNASSARNLQLLVALWDPNHAHSASKKLSELLLQSGTTFLSCNICFSNPDEEQGTRIEGCGHTLCKTCLQSHIESKLNDSVWPVYCPICIANAGTAKNAAVISRFIVDELDLSKTTKQRWSNFEVAEFLNHMNCIQCKADFYVEMYQPKTTNIITCPQPKCQTSWCKKCDQLVGPKSQHDCSDVVFQKLAKEQRWKKCPNEKCGIMCERISGCENMTCRCGMYFCYLCGKPKSNHSVCNPT